MTKDPKLFLEAPLLIIGFGLMATGITQMDNNPSLGIGLIALAGALVIIEKYIEGK